MIDQAIHHRLAAGDFQTAALLIERHAKDIEWEQGQLAILGWLDELPQELVYSRPELCLIAASCLHGAGQLEAIEPYLQTIEGSLREAGFDPAAPQCQGNQKSAEQRYTMARLLSIRARVTLMVQGDPARAVE